MATASSSSAKKPAKSKQYENNPFKLGLNGVNLVINSARGVAILLIIVGIISTFSSSWSDSSTSSSADPVDQIRSAVSSLTPGQSIAIAAAVTIVVLGVVFLGSMISGIGAYTSARTARGHNVKLSEAFHAVLERFFSYIWLQIILTVKIILWSLLLIVPGIIMMTRYSLANVAFFDKGLSGNAAVKESLRLTKGAWITTFASTALFNIVTLGIIAELVSTGVTSLLYRQYTQFKDGEEKPKAHVLSWVTLLVIFVGLPILALLAFAALFALSAIGGGFSAGR